MDDKRSTLKSVLIWVAVILIPAILIFAGLLSGTRRGVEVELARIRAAGEPVCAKDLAGPPIPPDQNAALIYNQAFQMLKSSIYKPHVETLQAVDLTKPIGPIKIDWPEVEKASTGVGGIVALARQAAELPRCHYQVDYSPGPATLFTHLSQVRSLERVLSAASLVEARRGNTDGAAELLRLAIRTGHSVKDEPTLIATLVQMACLHISTSALQRVMESCDLSESQARQLYDDLGQVDLLHSYKIAMQGERVMGLITFDMVRQQKSGMTAAFAHGNLDPLSYAGSYAWRPFLNADQSVYLKFSRHYVDTANTTCRETKIKGIHPPSDADIPTYARISSIIAPVWERARSARDMAMSKVALARTALALRAYKARFGAYPAKLAELKTRLGWKLPEDPCSGRDLHYRRKPTGFLIYSIGLDFKDDGGKPQQIKNGQSNPTAPGDIVWEAIR